METKLRVRPLLVCDLSNIVIKPFSVGVTITSSICSNCSEQATRWSVDTSFLKRGARDVTGARTVCRRKMSEAMPCKWAHVQMCAYHHPWSPRSHGQGTGVSIHHPHVFFGFVTGKGRSLEVKATSSFQLQSRVLFVLIHFFWWSSAGVGPAVTHRVETRCRHLVHLVAISGHPVSPPAIPQTYMNACR